MCAPGVCVCRCACLCECACVCICGGVTVCTWPPTNDCVNKKRDGEGYTSGITVITGLGTAKPLDGRRKESRKDKLHVFWGRLGRQSSAWSRSTNRSGERREGDPPTIMGNLYLQ